MVVRLPRTDLLYVFRERKEYAVFRDLLRMIPGLEGRLMESSEEEVVAIADLVMSSVDSIVHYSLTAAGF